MRSVTHSDSDDVLSGRREPPNPFLGYERVTRRSADQESLEHHIGFTEDNVTELQDAIGMASAEDFDQSAWRLVDRIEQAASRLGQAGQELRSRL